MVPYVESALSEADDNAAHYLANTMPMYGGECADRHKSDVVYAAFDEEGNAIYVGVTASESNRLTAHIHTSRWWDQMSYLRRYKVCCRKHAENLETLLICELQPAYNKHIPVVTGEARLAIFDDAMREAASR